MKFAFRPLALQVFCSISPAQLTNPLSASESTRKKTLDLVTSLPLDFMEKLLHIRRPKEQSLFIHNTRICINKLIRKIESHLDILPEMELSFKDRDVCAHFYTKILDEIVLFEEFLQTECTGQPCKKQMPGIKTPIQTTLSVSQLGVFLRLQVDAGLVATDNKTELVKQVAEIHSTTRQSGISADNLRKHFYKPEHAALSIMHTHLLSMLNLLKSYRSLFLCFVQAGFCPEMAEVFAA